jgi:hypothetical protein
VCSGRGPYYLERFLDGIDSRAIGPRGNKRD